MINDAFKEDDFYSHFKEVWLQADALLEDSSFIRSKGEQYLHKNKSEESRDLQYERQYKDRLKNAYLPSGYKREVSAAVGKVFDNKESFKISDDQVNLPNIVMDYVKSNIDLANNSALRFARNCLYMAAHKGCSPVLVEYSSEYSRAFVNLIDPKWIINYKEKDHRLFDIRILDSYEDDEGKIHELSRRYFLDKKGDAFVEKYIRYRDKKTGKEVIELVDGKTVPLLDPMGRNIRIIPIYEAYGSSDYYKARFRSYPLMQSLIENTIRLYNLESNLDSLLSFVSRVFPIPYIYKQPDLASGIQGSMGDSDHSTLETLSSRIGTRQFIETTPGEELRILEFNQQQIEPLERRIKELKEERTQMGLTSLLTRTPGRIAATVKTIEQVEVNSILQEVVIGQTDLWYGILNLVAIREGITEGFKGVVTINHDFGQIGQDWAISTENLKIMQNDVASGLLSLETYIKAKAAMGAYGPYSDEINIEDEIAKIDILGASSIDDEK